MDVRRGVAAGLVGLALLAGATGCSKIGEKVAEEAVERNSDCENVDINTDEGGFAGNCNGNDIDANISGNADLPDGYPAELAPPEGYEIISSTGTATPVQTYDVFGTMVGEVGTVYEQVKTQLTDAGYTVDTDSLAEGPTGPVGNFTATGPDYTAVVTVSEVATDDGEISVNYAVTAAG